MRNDGGSIAIKYQTKLLKIVSQYFARMKLLAFALVSIDAAKFPRTYGCDPAELEHYDITRTCKRNKGFFTDGVYLEKKGNFCKRQCRYTRSLPETTYVQCYCAKNWSTYTWDCSYRMKLAKTGGLKAIKTFFA